MFNLTQSLTAKEAALFRGANRHVGAAMASAPDKRDRTLPLWNQFTAMQRQWADSVRETEASPTTG